MLHFLPLSSFHQNRSCVLACTNSINLSPFLLAVICRIWARVAYTYEPSKSTLFATSRMAAILSAHRTSTAGKENKGGRMKEMSAMDNMRVKNICCVGKLTTDSLTTVARVRQGKDSYLLTYRINFYTMLVTITTTSVDTEGRVGYCYVPLQLGKYSFRQDRKLIQNKFVSIF